MAGALRANRGNKGGTRHGATVSRRLKEAGFRISSAVDRGKRDGVFVRQLDETISVLVDLGSPDNNRATAADIAGTVSSWDRVSDLRMTDSGGVIHIRFTYA